MTEGELVQSLQCRAARAQPADHHEIVDGWTLRHATGSSWWVGSVLPFGDVEPLRLERRVEEAEAFYAAHGAVARFQITPGTCPPGLDTVLAERGYRRHGEMSLQQAGSTVLLERLATTSMQVRLAARPTPAWLDVSEVVHGPPRHARLEGERLRRVDSPAVYACALLDGDVVAVGRAVADAGWAGVFGMATVPEARGRGAARTVLAALAEWALQQNVDRMYLQVERANVAALRLYERARFSEVCGYHYRSR